MVADVADALEYAHKNGVIHCDIKPLNLLLAPVGRLSFNDFGLARMLEQPGMTMTGEFVGTPAYMSPRARGRVKRSHRIRGASRAANPTVWQSRRNSWGCMNSQWQRANEMAVLLEQMKPEAPADQIILGRQQIRSERCRHL
jgi:serine/threonine protein kinase